MAVREPQESLGCVTFEGRVPTHWRECCHVQQVSVTEWTAPPRSVSGGSVKCLRWKQDRKTRAHTRTCTGSDSLAGRTSPDPILLPEDSFSHLEAPGGVLGQVGVCA